MKSQRKRGLAVTAAAAAALAMFGTSGIAQASDHRPDAKPVKIDGKRPSLPLSMAKGIVPPVMAKQQTRTWFVQFKGQGAAALGHDGRAAVLSRRGAVERQATSALSTARGRDGKAAEVFTLTNSVPGVAIRTNGAGAAALAKRPDVVSVKAVVPRTAENANAAVLQKAVNVWRQANGLGANVRIGIIDTGIDYTHADFGGPGTVDAYNNQDPTAADWRTTLPALGQAKIKGGYDFAGDDYQANDTLADGSPNPDYQPNPHPDSNPLDCNEHGTHVAGTVGGYGVTKGGKTFTGNYANLDKDKLLAMNVGPGMAPKSELYGLKVFGCDGSTDLVMPALDWALDPNHDGDFSDHLDIVNMSLGSSYGPVDDPENLVVNSLAKHGVLSVISAGNDGDVTDIAGTPGTAASALTVAASVDAYQLLDGLKVNTPAEDAGTVAGQFSIAYDWANEPPVSGDVVKLSDPNNQDGCDTLSDADAAAVDGKVAWLTWDSNDATRRCGSVARSGNVKAAGAIGAIFTGDVKPFGAGITGDEDIPVFQLTPDATQKLDPAATAGTLNVTFDGALRSSAKDIDHSLDDTLATFSSRGAHGSLGVVKPDVAAVGDSVASAGVGSGNQALSLSGTSMAAPNTTGIAALVKARHPGWGPLQVKAAVMNTATHDVWTDKGRTGHRFAPARVGSGRVDAKNASNTDVLAYQPGHHGVGSVVFGVVPAAPGQTVTKTRKVRLVNSGAKATTLALGFDIVNPGRGVHYKVTPKSVTLGAHKSRTVTVTMKAVARKLRHTIDPTMDPSEPNFGLDRTFVSDSSGWLTVTPSGKSSMRLPVFTAAKPTSNTTASATEGGINLDGQGVNQGSAPDFYGSGAAVLQLGAESGKSAACTYPKTIPGCEQSNDRASDIKAIGAGTGQDFFGGNVLQFGISTWGDWANLDVLTPYVDFDTDGDGNYDYETFVTNFRDTDTFMVETVDYNTGQAVDLELLNNYQGLGVIDTNPFDTNVVLLPVYLNQLDISAPITYTAGVFNAYTGETPDSVTAEYDVENPDVSTPAVLYEDDGGQTIPVDAAPGAQALVLHLYGQKGARDEVVSFPNITN